ncbi:MAG: glycosyltransferase family 2 protein [Rhodospirillaceae bacterium]
MRILVALLVACLASASLWASLDKPMDAPDWRGQFKGVSYSPSHIYTEEQLTAGIDPEIIRRDLEQLAGVTKRVRTYTVDNGIDAVPYLAKEFGLKITLGVWLSGDKELNEIEVTKAIKAVNDNPGVVDRVVVGNEVVMRGELTAAEVSDYIVRVRKAVTNKKVEVGTAEVWSVWLDHPQLAKESAFVGIHLLPYWEGIKSEDGMDYVSSRFDMVAKKFPDKKIVIGEAGWPSDGRVKKGSVPSPAMEAYFLRHFLTLATAKNYDYYVIEAFDQPWKGAAGQEGAVGAYWGIYDAEGNSKLALTGHLTSFPDWAQYAGAATIATFLIGLMILMVVPTMSLQGYALVAGIIGVCISGALFIVEASSLRYVQLNALWGAAIIIPAAVFTALLLITETTEWALSLWRAKRLPRIGATGYIGTPRVSIHLPIHNEPPQMVIQTLNALARLDYPNFEVIILDNNTRDASLWKPVEAHAQALGERFRFYHFDGVKGFKAGALNIALKLTDPAAEYVAVIDSDYQVSPEWLKAMMPGFADRKVAVVQSPQDYRDAGESLFKKFCYEEYATFFHVGMVERNEHNAIIQHGTMCIIRRSAMEEVGGWAEWCITEDTELGLRLFEAGYSALYAPASMGRGLMPDTYDAYKSQRYRWVYGAMQIMKRHAVQLFTGKSTLTPAQRYHFLAGWLPWFADAFALVFGVLSLVWTALMAIAPRHFDVPLTALSGVALTLFTLKTAKTVLLHRAKVGTGTAGAVAAALTGLSLAFTVGRGVLAGLFTSGKPFMVTPKCKDMAGWARALRIAATETALLIATVAAIASTAIIGRLDDPAEVVWCLALAVLAIPYASALLVALGSTVQFGSRSLPQAELAPVLQPQKLDLAA